MLARNSLLYFELSASWSARSSSVPPGHLDLAVLHLDAPVLLLQELRLVLQLGVGLLQLLLLRLQQLLGRLQRRGLLLELGVRALELLLLGLQLLGLQLQLLGQSLRLLEQLLGPHVGDDRVDGDADRLHELVEERLVHVAERPERRQLDHAEDLVLEQHRQDDQVDRQRLASPT
jgi:hypothetical protein